jgi:hypothetical protein
MAAAAPLLDPIPILGSVDDRERGGVGASASICLLGHLHGWFLPHPMLTHERAADADEVLSLRIIWVVFTPLLDDGSQRMIGGQSLDRQLLVGHLPHIR